MVNGVVRAKEMMRQYQLIAHYLEVLRRILLTKSRCNLIHDVHHPEHDEESMSKANHKQRAPHLICTTLSSPAAWYLGMVSSLISTMITYIRAQMARTYRSAGLPIVLETRSSAGSFL